jgi:hypothetical protein
MYYLNTRVDGGGINVPFVLINNFSNFKQLRIAQDISFGGILGYEPNVNN